VTYWGPAVAVAGRPVVLVANPAAAIGAREVIELAGGQVAAAFDWTRSAALDDATFGAVVLIEAQGIAPDLLTDRLDQIAGAARDRDLRLIAILDPDQIDHAAALLLDFDAALLVEATPADRAVALIAAGTGSTAVREDERERLARLNEEIARIAEMLARLSDDAPDAPGQIADRSSAFHPRAKGIAVDPQVIRQAIRARRMRDGFFPPALFEDPAWDMLLDLFAAELEGGSVSVSSLCIAAAVAPTTALRWIGRMTAGGLLARRPDPGDRRRAFVVLTDQASSGMRGYAAALARAALPFV
jgi:hypothetical protein